MAVALAACSDHHTYQPQPQVYQQPAPVVVQNPVQQPTVVAAPAPVIINQAPAASSDHMMTGALMGGALGYMAGRGSSSGTTYVDRRPVIVNKTTVVKQYNAPKTVNVTQQRSTYVPPSSPKLSLSKSSSSSSRSFGGFSRRK